MFCEKVSLGSLVLLFLGCGNAPKFIPPPPPAEQCPFGSSFTLDQSLVTQCGGKAGVDVKTQSGELAGKCFQDDKSLYVCKIEPSHSKIAEECVKQPGKALRFTQNKIECVPAVSQSGSATPRSPNTTPSTTPAPSSGQEYKISGETSFDGKTDEKFGSCGISLSLFHSAGHMARCDTIERNGKCGIRAIIEDPSAGCNRGEDGPHDGKNSARATTCQQYITCILSPVEK